MIKLYFTAKGGNRSRLGIFDIDADFLLNMWHLQNGRCYLSGHQMSHKTNSDWKCSLERLDNSKGYERANVSLICQEFNTVCQWTPALIQELPHKTNAFVDVDKMDNIFNLMHQMDSLPNRERKCIHCKSHKVVGRNSFCEQCKEQQPNTVSHWKFIQTKLKTAKYDSSMRKAKCSLRGRFELSAKWAKETLEQQQYRCHYSNIPLEFEKGSPWTLSPERLNNDYGYTPDNTRFICQLFQSSGNTAPKYNITGSPQWNREKLNEILMHRHGISIDYSSMFT